MKDASENLLAFIVAIAYMMGIVLAPTLKLKIIAFMFPPYPLYLTVEKLMHLAGII